MRTRQLFQTLLTAMALTSASSAFCLQESLLFECNEDAGVLGVSKSRSEFGQSYNTHPGFKAQSANGKYRTWTVAAVSSTTRDFEWTCRIGKNDAVINVWHQNSSKDELIEKYGIRHESCGAFRKLRLTYDSKVVVEDTIMESDGCADVKFSLKTFYFAMKTDHSKSETGFYFDGTLAIGRRTAWIGADIDIPNLFVRKNGIRWRLPVSDKTIDALLPK